MLDTVRVAPDTFSSLVFMGSTQRKEFTRDNRPSSEKPQKVNGDGVPVWSLQVAAVSWRSIPQMLSVTVAMYDDPAKKFKAGDPVQLTGLVFGVTPKRDGGFVIWWSTDSVSAVGAAAAKPTASV